MRDLDVLGREAVGAMQHEQRGRGQVSGRAGVEHGQQQLAAVWCRDRVPRCAEAFGAEYIVDFPVVEILSRLNAVEGLDPQSGWGGSENVGGSPRGRGSALAPQQVAAIVNQVVEEHRARFPR